MSIVNDIERLKLDRKNLVNTTSLSFYTGMLSVALKSGSGCDSGEGKGRREMMVASASNDVLKNFTQVILARAIEKIDDELERIKGALDEDSN